jgi:hypothetical protein
LGFAILAVVIVLSWKRLNGSPPAVTPANGNGLTVTYHQLVTLTSDVERLSLSLAGYHGEIRLYHQAAEKAAAERHKELSVWHDEHGTLVLHHITTVGEWMKKHPHQAA